jgi:hypothetical protein
MPFIWFWPDRHSSCAILTHDIETEAGRDFCKQVMDFDDEAGIKASFQVVPEKRYTIPEGYLESIRERGFEVNIHGLDHSGNLFQGREEFLKRAKKINDYARQYGALGFRSPVLYRNIDWFQDLRFSYDMSVPNVGRLEPQRGGCCTVMPYFLPGGMTELPLTTTEDYSLFHVLGDYSTTVWAKQIKMILQSHGMMSFLVHPDYVTSGPAQNAYRQLLGEIAALRADSDVWIALPGEVDLWWRQRRAMNLVWAGKTWKLDGPGSERAHVAHAVLDGDRLGYEL